MFTDHEIDRLAEECVCLGHRPAMKMAIADTLEWVIETLSKKLAENPCLLTGMQKASEYRRALTNVYKEELSP